MTYFLVVSWVFEKMENIGVALIGTPPEALSIKNGWRIRNIQNGGPEFFAKDK